MLYTIRVEKLNHGGGVMSEVYFVVDPVGRKVANCFRGEDAEKIVRALNYEDFAADEREESDEDDFL